MQVKFSSKQQVAYYELHKAWTSHDRRITTKYWIKPKTLSLDDCEEVQHWMWQIIGYVALERKTDPRSQGGIVFNEHRWDWALERHSVAFSNHCHGGSLGEFCESNNRKLSDHVIKELMQTPPCVIIAVLLSWCTCGICFLFLNNWKKRHGQTNLSNSDS